MKEKLKKLTKLDILGIVLTVIFLPIIIINMTLVIKGMINPEEVPMLFNRAPLIVKPDTESIDSLRLELNRLVSEENYEQAAVVRDKIRKLEAENNE